MKTVIDFETRSKVDIRKQGAYIYAQHPSTDVLCLAVKEDYKATRLWVPQHHRHMMRTWPEDLLSVIDDVEMLRIINASAEIHAHNAQFERLIFKYVMPRMMSQALNFRVPSETVWRCTAAKAAAHSLPRDLAGACAALKLPVQKDQDGYKVMMQMCKPNAAGRWVEDPQKFYKLAAYCIRDVDAEHCLDAALPDLPEQEQTLYFLDQKINDKGMCVDVDAIRNLAMKVAHKEDKLLREIQLITENEVQSVRQIDRTKIWLSRNGIDLDNLQKATVEDALARDDLPEAVRSVLSIRRSLAKSSVAKLNTMLMMASEDARVRGAFLFNGAGTGRWAGRRIQPHNYPRECLTEAQIDELLTWGIERVDEEYGCTIRAASKCLRGMITAERGKLLKCADFSSIEARVLAWVANEENDLDAFRTGKDLYKVAASSIYQRAYDAVTSDERQVGKVAVLALGYQGWVGAFKQMATGYGVDYPQDMREMLVQDVMARRQPEDVDNPVTEEEIFERWAAPIILRWRDAHPNIVAFWHGVNDAALRAVEEGGVFQYNGIMFGVRNNFLYCKLPSGRMLAYYDPKIQEVTTKYKQKKMCVSYMGVDSQTGRYVRQFTYGGKLTENIVQAIARDLLAEAMLRLDLHGYEIVMHVHDEIVTEIDPFDESMDYDSFYNLMSEVPSWAAGCPVAATGWTGRRYRKD